MEKRKKITIQKWPFEGGCVKNVLKSLDGPKGNGFLFEGFTRMREDKFKTVQANNFNTFSIPHSQA